MINYNLFRGKIKEVDVPDYCSDFVLAKKVLDYMELYNFTYSIHAPDETLPLMPRYGYAIEYVNLETQELCHVEAMRLEKAICVGALAILGYLTENDLR